LHCRSLVTGERHSLRTGLTGPAQIRFLRGATDREADPTSRLKADPEYISGWTIFARHSDMGSNNSDPVARAFVLNASLAAAPANRHVTGVIETGFHALPDDRRIAFRQRLGREPTIVFLPGYISDMAGSKAVALFDWAGETDRACLLFDYSGCGESPGDFADGTLSRWCEEAVAMIETRTQGPVLLVGSSMGGWLMLLVARALGDRVAALVGIAAAPDFTEWGYNACQKARLAAGETLRLANPYGPEPTPVYPGFWADGETLRQLEHEIPFDGRVRLLHGQDDADVPPEISLRLAAALRSEDVQVTLVKGGDHRLSRESDIALLLRTLAALT
jgi:pimeloyl-ACP methyl ester carboxylesterase